MVTDFEPDFVVMQVGFDDYQAKPGLKADLHDVVKELLTRTNYDETPLDYYALVAKREVLETEKNRPELTHDPRNGVLMAGIAEYEPELNREQNNIEPEDHAVAVRDHGVELES